MVRRELYPFEREILVRFALGGKFAASPKGEWIRGYLIINREGCSYEMWKEYAYFATNYLLIKPGSYINFAWYMWVLKKLGLVRVVRVERTKRGLNKHYYAITPGMENSPLWRRPVQTLYSSTDWTIMPYEVKSALREKYRK